MGRYLNGYGTQNPDDTRDPAGLGGLELDRRPDHLQLHQVDDERERAGVRGGRRRRVPDRLPRPARLRGDRPGGRRPAPVLPLAHVPGARTAARPIESDDPPSLRTPSPAPRHRNAFANVPLPRPPNFGRADRYTQAPDRGGPPPLHRRGRGGDPGELPAGARVAAVGGRRGGTADGHAGGHRRARQHADHLHLGQRLLPRRAPGALGEGAALRAGHPHPADHARARGARGPPPGPARGQRGPGAHDPGRRRGHPRPGAGRPLAVQPAARPQPASWAASSCWRTAAA